MTHEKEVTGGFKYFAFISYSRQDIAEARWLQRKLEWYRFPNNIDEKCRPPHPRYIRPVVLDKTDLEVDEKPFWDNIKGKLDASKYLIVLCSAESARSPYVDKEIRHFLNNPERGANVADSIIPVLLEDDLESCLPAVLRDLGDTISMRNLPRMIADPGESCKQGRLNGLLQTVSILLHVKREDIMDRYRKAKKRTAILTTSIIAAMIFLISALGMWGVKSKTEQQAVRLYKEGSQYLNNNSPGNALAAFAGAVEVAHHEPSAARIALLMQTVTWPLFRFAGPPGDLSPYGHMLSVSGEKNTRLLNPVDFTDQARLNEKRPTYERLFMQTASANQSGEVRPLDKTKLYENSFVTYSGDGRYLATCAINANEQTFSGWRIIVRTHDGEEQFKCDIQAFPGALSLAHNGKHLAISHGKQIRIYSLYGDSSVHEIQCEDVVEKIAVAPEGNSVILLSGEELGVWQFQGNSFVRDQHWDLSSLFPVLTRDKLMKQNLEKEESNENTDLLMELYKDSKLNIPSGMQDENLKAMGLFNDHVQLSISPDGQFAGLGMGTHAALVSISHPESTPVGFRFIHRFSQLAFSPDSRHLAFAMDHYGRSGAVWVADTVTKTILTHKPRHPDGGIRHCQFDPMGTRLLTVGTDNTVRIWNIQNGEEVMAPIRVTTGPVKSAEFCENGRYICVACEDHTETWELGCAPSGIPRVSSGIVAANKCRTRDNMVVLARYFDSMASDDQMPPGEAVCFDLTSSRKKWQVPCSLRTGVREVDLSSSGETLLSCGQGISGYPPPTPGRRDDMVLVVNPDGDIPRQWPCPKQASLDFARWSPDSKHILVHLYDKQGSFLQILDGENLIPVSKEIRPEIATNNVFGSAIWHPSGNFIIATTTRHFPWDDGAPMHGGKVSQKRVLPHLFLYELNNHSHRAFPINTGEKSDLDALFVLPTSGEVVLRSTYSNASAAHIFFVDLASEGQRSAAFQSKVLTTVLSPDAQTLAVASYGGNVDLLDIKTAAKQPVPVNLKSQEISSLAFDKTGGLLLIGTEAMSSESPSMPGQSGDDHIDFKAVFCIWDIPMNTEFFRNTGHDTIVSVWSTPQNTLSWATLGGAIFTLYVPEDVPSWLAAFTGKIARTEWIPSTDSYQNISDFAPQPVIGESPWATLANWLVSPTIKRTVWPGSLILVDKFVETLVAAEDNLETAIRLYPTNAPAVMSHTLDGVRGRHPWIPKQSRLAYLYGICREMESWGTATADAWISACKAYWWTNDFVSAVDAAQKAHGLNPDDAETNWCLAQALQLSGNLEWTDESARYLRSATQTYRLSNPMELNKMVQFHSTYWECLCRLDRRKEIPPAFAEFMDVIRPWGQRQIAVSLLQRMETVSALSYTTSSLVKNLVDNRLDDQARQWVAFCRATIESFKELNPNDESILIAEDYFKLVEAELLIYSKQIGQAEDIYYNMDDSNSPLVRLSAQLGIGCCRAARNDPSGALNLFLPLKRYLRLPMGNPPDLDKTFINGLIDVLYQMRRRGVGAETFHTIVEALPSSALTVLSVHPKGQAAPTGIQTGDIIWRYKGERVHSLCQLYDLRNTLIEPFTDIQILRGGAFHTMQILRGQLGLAISERLLPDGAEG